MPVLNRAKPYAAPVLAATAVTGALVGTLLFVGLHQDTPKDNAMGENAINETDLTAFKRWPISSMTEFMVIHDSVMHIYRTGEWERFYPIDKNRKLGVMKDKMAMYFDNSEGTEPTAEMYRRGDFNVLPLTLRAYTDVRAYFNGLLQP